MAEAIQEVSEVRDQFKQAFSDGDAAAVANLFAQDARLLPAGHPTLRGRAEIQDYFQDVFRQMENQRIAITPSETEVRGELVYEWGTSEVTFTPHGGEQTSTQGRFTVILERQDNDSYKLVLEITNSPQSPAP